MSERYFDDFEVGERFVSRGVTFSEGQIIDFALVYDPQPFHIDKEAARESHYGGLIASGFQTLALAWRMMSQENLLTACSMGSPGIDELRWLKPVRPGDTVRTEVVVREKRPSESKPDRGVLMMAYELKNQDGEPVLSFSLIHLVRRRPG